MTTPQQKLPGPERDRLVEQHLKYVRAIVGRIRRDLSTDLDFDELEAYGMRGLVEAANRYDPTRGVAFSTFSYYRIRGAVFDGLRQMGWLSRSHYARAQASSNELLQNLADRQPSAADEGGIEQAVSNVARTIDQIATTFIVSLDDTRTPEPADPQAVDAADALEREGARDAVRRAVEHLPERERTLIELYYFRGLTLQAVGDALGLSKSWTSRLHARAIGLLTEHLGPTFDPAI